MLERADAGDSFEQDFVRAKFGTRKRNEFNAGGLIVTVDDEADFPKDLTLRRSRAWSRRDSLPSTS